MCATIDISIAKEIFIENHGRQPYMFEVPMLVQLTTMTTFLARDSFIAMWKSRNGVADPPELVVEDEFSRMGEL